MRIMLALFSTRCNRVCAPGLSSRGAYNVRSLRVRAGCVLGVGRDGIQWVQRLWRQKESVDSYALISCLRDNMRVPGGASCARKKGRSSGGVQGGGGTRSAGTSTERHKHVGRSACVA